MFSGSIATLVLIGVIIIVLAILFSFVPVALWISALAAGVRVGIFTLIGMRLRRVIPSRVINPLIKAQKAGLNLTTNQLESHYLAGGNVDRVVNALIAAHRANIDLTFERSAAIDLAGRDVLEAVQMSVNPKVIETPFIAGVALDGIEVKAKARITVRANIERLVGGAGEETIIARVGKVLFLPLVQVRIIKRFWKIQTPFPKPFYPKDWIPEPRLKFCQLILLILILARILGQHCRPTRRWLIKTLHRRRRKNAGPWLLPTNRK